MTLTKHKFIVLMSFIVFEIISFIIIFINYKPIYSKIFEQIKELSIEQTINIANNINEFFRITFIRYYLDLKIIGKHMSLLANNEINNNSKYYKNLVQDENKHIIYGTTEDLIKNFSEYYDDYTEKFLFLENYVKKYFENDTNQFDKLNYLMNNTLHPELNCIAYYKVNGSINDIENNLKRKTAVKYLLSILKTNFLNRFIVKGEDYELVHYFLLVDDEMYIYPPESYNNSLIYFIRSSYCSNDFPECFYTLLSIIFH